MKKRILSFALCVIMIFSSVPINEAGVGAYLSASAVNLAELEALVSEIPEKQYWERDFVDSTTLGLWYDQAIKIFENYDAYDQTNIDLVTSSLRNAFESVKYHTQEIELNKNAVSVNVGEELQLSAILTPQNAADSVSWKSEDESKVSVSSNGLVKVLKFSDEPVKITATSNSHSAYCLVTTLNPLAAIKLTQPSVSSFEGDFFKISATAVGKDETAATTDSVTFNYYSHKPSVASGDSNGLVTAVSKGTATIRVTATNGKDSFSADCTVTVNELIQITGIVVNSNLISNAIEMTVGEEENFKVTITPSTASKKTLKWTSSEPSVASVNQTEIAGSVITANIKALKAGTTKITYETTDGSDKSGYFTVVVNPRVAALSISESFKVVALTSSGEKLVVTALPSNAGNKTLRWTTDDPSVCTVDMNGVLEPVGSGLCTITASTTDGSNISISCRIRVAPAASSVTLDKTKLTLKNGEKKTLKATVTTVNNTTYGDVEWISSNPKVAYVDENGVVTGIGRGEATIKAITRDGTDRFAVCSVTVTQSVTSVSLPEKLVLGVGGKTAVLTATVKPSNANNTNVTWKSSNPSVATVNQSGLVTSGNSVGTCTVTATTEDGGFVAECLVYVNILPTGITLDKSSETVAAGEKIELKATVKPSDATDKTVTWKSSNSKVATVENGVVTAVAGGSCTITAYNAAGQSAKCVVNVTQGIDTITLTPSSATMYISQTMTLKKTVSPSTTTVTEFKWSSNNTSVVTVDQNGKVTAKGSGNAVVSVEADGKKADCVITVVEKVIVTGIKIDSAASIKKGEQKAIGVTVYPNEASDKSVTWSSSNPSVAVVSSSGVVTGVAPGKTVITAKTNDGGYTDTCNITVVQSVTSVRISTGDFRLAKGKAKAVIANVFPADATNKDLIWTSANKTVATVTDGGVVTAKAAGSTSITATSVDGGFSATVTVTVYIPVTSITINAKSMTVPKGEKRLLTANVEPSDATDDTIKWKTSDKSVVSVNEATGQIEAKKTGTATITAISSDGNCKSSCVITVVQLATSISINFTTVTLVAGKTKIVKATMKPAGVTNTTVKWSSSNKKVAKVSSKGKITAVAGGSTVIKATSGDGNVFATCRVNVLQPATAVKLNKTKASVKIGKTLVLTTTLEPETTTTKKVIWTSSDEKIATVDKYGVVTGIKKGTVTITATAENTDVSAKCKVTVKKAVTGVSLDKTVVSVSVGKKVAVNATVKPSSASDKRVTWSSTNKDVATVSSSGIITAKSVGYAEIIAKTKDGGFKAVCRVLVIQSVSGIKLNVKKKTLDFDETYTLKATVKPSNATNKDVVWSSSNKKVAKVNSKGKITALKSGTATITAVTKDGGYSAKCVVTVQRRVRDVSISKSSLLLYLDKTAKLKASVTPSDATDTSVTWTSSNEKVLRVKNGKLTPVKPGSATITVKTNDGGYTATCKVTVERAAKSVELSKKSVTVKSGSTYTLKATVSPSNTTNKKVTWTSSNPAVATVNSKGVVKGIGGGTATITCKTSNGLTAKCSVKVTQSASGVSLSKTAASVYTGEAVKLYATVSPTGATNKAVTWSSSNKAVATVSSGGSVKGVKAGTAVITATTVDGGFKASCTVTVLQHAVSVSINQKEISVAKGGKATVSATVLPSDTTNKDVSWSSSDTSVVTITSLGEITAHKTGTATITVTTVDGEKTATCNVTVFEPVTDITIDITEKTIFNSESFVLEAAVSPSDASNKLIKWSSSNSLVASVSSSGEVVGIKSGTAVITATTVDGGFKASCTVTVLQKATGIKLDKENLEIFASQEGKLTATVLPEDCYLKNVSWKSSDETVVTVDQDGNLKALVPGYATVTATSEDGGFVASCRITVNRAVTGIEISKSEAWIYNGETLTLEAVVQPYDATNKAVVWKSSDINVASVENGVVTGVGKGTAIISAETVDGGFMAVCTVEVKIKTGEIQLSKTEITLSEGLEAEIEAVVLPETAENKKVLWSSSDETVATVENGKVVAVSKGEAVITAVSEQNSDIKAECFVKVTKPVSEVVFNENSLVLFVSESAEIEAVVLPENASNKELVWTSSDETVATVENGKIVAVSKGEAVITATSVDGGKTAQCNVEVKQAATEVKFEASEAEVEKGLTLTLSAVVLPDNTNDKTLVWSSSDEEIATVENGVVSAHKSGETIITAKALVGGAENKIKVVVTEPVVSIEVLSDSKELWVEDTLKLYTKILPENATYQNVSWSSGNEEIITVSQDGVVTAHKAGQTEISALSHCGKVVGKINLTVRQQATAVILNKTEIAVDENGDEENGKYQLTAEVAPLNADYKGITWKSENSDIAQVSEDGLVTAMGKGETYIVATSEDGKAFAKCKVSVMKLVTDIEISDEALSLGKGEKAVLSAYAIPEDATDTAISWISENEDVATVSENGEVTAVKGGTAVIKALTSNEEVFAVCNVTVVVYSESLSLNKTEHEVWVGEKFSFETSVMPEDTTNKAVKWSTDNEEILSVSDEGEFTALKAGEAKVIAETVDSSVKAECLVKVSIRTEKVEFTESSVTLEKGQSKTAVVTVYPEDATYKEVSFCSSDEAVATVSAKGEITALSVGTATITAETVEGGNKAELKVNVIQKPTALEAEKTEIRLDEGQSETAAVVFAPSDTTEKALEWFSSDEKIATVSQSGEITAVSKGVAVITATSKENSDVKTEITVNVIRRVKAFDIKEDETVLYIGKTANLSTVIDPAEVSDSSIKWSVSDEEVCSVSQSGEITALSVGTAIVFGETNDGSFMDFCLVTVKREIDSVSFDKEALSMRKRDKATILATVLPSEADSEDLLWISDNEDVATVKNGVVTSKETPGKATIKAVSKTNNEVFAQCEVTVIQSIDNFALSDESLRLRKGSEYTLGTIILPSNATNKTVEWSTSDESVATVTSDGTVTAVSAGTATIVAKTVDGGLTAVCAVKVLKEIESLSASSEKEILWNGEEVVINLSAEPSDHDEDFVYESSDSEVLKVDSDGRVTAIKSGEAKITIKSSVSGKTSEISFTVRQKVESVEFSQEEYQFYVSNNVALSYRVNPSDAYNKAVVWNSSDESVVKVDENGMLTCLKAGKATITVTTVDGGHTATCVVTVID